MVAHRVRDEDLVVGDHQGLWDKDMQVGEEWFWGRELRNILLV